MVDAAKEAGVKFFFFTYGWWRIHPLYSKPSAGGYLRSRSSPPASTRTACSTNVYSRAPYDKHNTHRAPRKSRRRSVPQSLRPRERYTTSRRFLDNFWKCAPIPFYYHLADSRPVASCSKISTIQSQSTRGPLPPSPPTHTRPSRRTSRLRGTTSSFPLPTNRPPPPRRARPRRYDRPCLRWGRRRRGRSVGITSRHQSLMRFVIRPAYLIQPEVHLLSPTERLLGCRKF
jgi:hypothetical protein